MRPADTLSRPARRCSQRRCLPALLCLALAWLAPAATALSEREELEIGREMHQKILESTPIYPDDELAAYVQRIGSELAQKSERADLEYTFTIIDSDDINAFATPGGYVYINRGLMAYMTSEAQLAAVLGHEVGHIAARHASRQQTAGTAANAASTVLAVLAGVYTGSSAAAGAVRDTSALAGTALVRGYGRDMELEADDLGAQYLAKTGYDAQAMAEVIGILKDEEDYRRLRAKDTGETYQGYHGVFSTHPRNDQRLQNIVRDAGANAGSDPTRSDNTEFRARMDRLKYSDDAIASTIVGSRYYHRGLDFTMAFPTGWEVSKNANVVQARGPADNAVMQLQVKRGPKEGTPADYLAQKFGATDLQRGEQLGSGDLVGYTGVQAGTNGGPDRRIAAWFHRGRAFVILAQTDNTALQTFYDTLFTASIEGFRPLSEEDQRAALTRQVRFLQARDGITFEQLARYSPLEEYAVQQLRLLNGYYPNGEPKAGEWIKVVD